LIFWVLIFEINDFSVSLDNEFCKSDLQKRENSQGKKKQLKIKIQAINSSESFEVLFQVKCLIILSRAEGILWEAIAGKIEYEDLEKFNLELFSILVGGVGGGLEGGCVLRAGA